MLPETGKISMKDVNVELKRIENNKINLNEEDVRKLADKPSGTIGMKDLRGKSSEVLIHKRIKFSESSKHYYPDYKWNTEHILSMPQQSFKNGYLILTDAGCGYHIYSTWAELYKNNGELIKNIEMDEYADPNENLQVGERIFVGDSSDNSMFPLTIKCGGTLEDMDEYGGYYPVTYSISFDLEADFIE